MALLCAGQFALYRNEVKIKKIIIIKKKKKQRNEVKKWRKRSGGR